MGHLNPLSYNSANGSISMFELAIVIKFTQSQELIPMTSKIIHTCPQLVFKYMDSPLRLSIRLWIKGCTKSDLGAQLTMQFPSKHYGELGIMIKYYTKGHSVQACYIFHAHINQLFGIIIYS